MSIVILDDTFALDELESIQSILEAAWDRESPSLVKSYGVPALLEAKYRIRLEVILNDSE